MKTSPSMLVFLIVPFIFSCQKEPLLVHNDVEIDFTNERVTARYQQKKNVEFISIYDPNSIEPTNNDQKLATDIPQNTQYSTSFLSEDDWDWWKVRAVSNTGNPINLTLDVNTIGLSQVKLDIYTPSGAHIEQFIDPASNATAAILLPNLVGNTYVYVKISQVGAAQESQKNYSLRFKPTI
jgi:hypothetical protein